MGPMEPNSLGGHRYMCCLTCDNTSYVWVFFLKLKDQTLLNIKAFVLMTEKQTSLKIKFFHLDRGSEFMLDKYTKFLQEQGITCEMSAPYTPQQNGVAEYMNQTLLGGAQSMMEHAGMTKGFWAKAIGVAAHVLNHFPHKGLDWRMLYELLYSRVLEVSYLRVFRIAEIWYGCLEKFSCGVRVAQKTSNDKTSSNGSCA